MDQEMDYLLQKTQHIEAEAQRLARIEHRYKIHLDMRTIQQTIPHTHQLSYSYNRPPSFGLIQDTFNFHPPAHQCQYPKENTLLMNTQQLTDRTSRHVHSARMSGSIQKHVENSDLYLQTTRQIKEKIKAER